MRSVCERELDHLGYSIGRICTLSLCFLASAAGVGLRRSTART